MGCREEPLVDSERRDMIGHSPTVVLAAGVGVGVGGIEAFVPESVRRLLKNKSLTIKDGSVNPRTVQFLRHCTHKK